ncbi:MAG: archaeosine biosynthesis radical SAM protein RaSEA [Candidatus Thermoplasmatota archaeon]
MGLKSEIRRFHEKTSRTNRKDLIAHWDEEELYRGEIKDVFSLIFRTKGCYRSYTSGCSMCGYYTDTNPEIKREDIEDQLEEGLSHYEGQDIVKIYTSGSFLDEDEIDDELAIKILESFDAEKTVIETRPEFVERERVEKLSQTVDELELALGLESTNDFVLENCINKGFTFSDYKNSVEEISDIVSVRTYLLLKPPFLTEKEAVKDLINSIKKISDLTDIISINPVNVQKGTLLEELWHRELYSPPWLWSLIEVLTSTVDLEIPIIVSKAGLGSERGAGNCEECTDKMIELLERFNKTQDISILKDLPQCECKDRWRFEKEIAPFLHFRGTPKILRDRYAGYV